MSVRGKSWAAGLAAAAVFGLAGCNDTGKTVEPKYEGPPNTNLKIIGGGAASGAPAAGAAGESLKKGDQ